MLIKEGAEIVVGLDVFRIDFQGGFEIRLGVPVAPRPGINVGAVVVSVRAAGIRPNRGIIRFQSLRSVVQGFMGNAQTIQKGGIAGVFFQGGAVKCRRFFKTSRIP